MAIATKSILAVTFLFFASFTWGGTSELGTEESLDLARYLGRWYQIALIPNKFQKKCARGTVADYSVGPGGELEVTNSCERKDGTVMSATGVARINDDYNDPARLEVSFAPEWMSWLSFVWGDYWILDIESGYQAVLVGSPDLKLLWVLARDVQIPQSTFRQFVLLAEEFGFPVRSIEIEPGVVFLAE